jgi:hypothetical protein
LGDQGEKISERGFEKNKREYRKGEGERRGGRS